MGLWRYKIRNLLFILLINGVAAYFKKKIALDDLKSIFLILLFAYDILMVVRSQSIEHLERDTYVLINILLQWCKLNFMGFNEEKTVYMLIRTKTPKWTLT